MTIITLHTNNKAPGVSEVIEQILYQDGEQTIFIKSEGSYEEIGEKRAENGEPVHVTITGEHLVIEGYANMLVEAGAPVDLTLSDDYSMSISAGDVEYHGWEREHEVSYLVQEKMARAMASVDPLGPEDWDEVSQEEREIYWAKARAARLALG